MPKKLLLKPLGSFIVGLQQTESVRSKFILVKSAEKRVAVTDVLAIGPDVTRVKVGDKIAFKEYADFQVSYGNVDYVIVDEADILATVAA